MSIASMATQSPVTNQSQCYNFRKQQILLGQICAVEKMSKKEIPQLWKSYNFIKISGCCYGDCDKFCD